MDKKILMQKAYNWIAEQDENGAIISDGDIDIASEFIAEFIQNLIDNGVLAEPSNESAVLPIHGVMPRFSEITKDSDDGAFSWILKDNRNADHPENNSDMIRRLVHKYNDLVKFLNGA